MARARQSESWNHTASILAMLVNVNRDSKRSRPAKPSEFHPLHGRRSSGIPLTKGNLKVLKSVFVDRSPAE